MERYLAVMVRVLTVQEADSRAAARSHSGSGTPANKQTKQSKTRQAVNTIITQEQLSEGCTSYAGGGSEISAVPYGLHHKHTSPRLKHRRE